MSFTKVVTKGVMTAALGLSLMSGGTYAYFSDTVSTQNTFASGTLDLSVNPNAVVNINNIKPGDEVYREFTLKNDGTLESIKYFWIQTTRWKTGKATTQRTSRSISR
jgi:spore coat-associated protein N